MILDVHVPGAPDHEIGDEIWQEPLADAIHFEADTAAFYAEDSDLLASPDQADRDELRDRIIAEMTAALTEVGDTYTAPDGVKYSLIDGYPEDLAEREETGQNGARTFPSMQLHRNSPVAEDEVPVDALVRTHWSLARELRL